MTGPYNEPPENSGIPHDGQAPQYQQPGQPPSGPPPQYDQPLSQDQQPRKTKKWPWIVGGIVVLLVVVGLFSDKPDKDETNDAASNPQASAAPASSEAPAAPASSEASEIPSSSAAPAVPSPDAAEQRRTEARQKLANCTAASEQLLAQIEAGITEAGLRLADGYIEQGEAGSQYFGANFFDEEGKRVSSADVWLLKGGVVYSLSSDARSRSSFPDGRRSPGASAGDEFGQRVQDCVTADILSGDGGCHLPG